MLTYLVLFFGRLFMGREAARRYLLRKFPPNPAGAMSLLLWIISWELTATTFLARRLFGAAWIGSEREWAAFVASLILSFHVFLGRRLSINRNEGHWANAVVVVSLMVGMGFFASWLLSPTFLGR